MRKSWTFKVEYEKTVEDSDTNSNGINPKQENIIGRILSWLISEWALYNSSLGYVTEVAFIIFVLVLFYKIIF